MVQGYEPDPQSQSDYLTLDRDELPLEVGNRITDTILSEQDFLRTVPLAC